jgi:hypothetical protein
VRRYARGVSSEWRRYLAALAAERGGSMLGWWAKYAGEAGVAGVLGVVGVRAMWEVLAEVMPDVSSLSAGVTTTPGKRRDVGESMDGRERRLSTEYRLSVRARGEVGRDESSVSSPRMLKSISATCRRTLSRGTAGTCTVRPWRGRMGRRTLGVVGGPVGKPMPSPAYPVSGAGVGGANDPNVP